MRFKVKSAAIHQTLWAMIDPYPSIRGDLEPVYRRQLTLGSGEQLQDIAITYSITEAREGYSDWYEKNTPQDGKREDDKVYGGLHYHASQMPSAFDPEYEPASLNYNIHVPSETMKLLLELAKHGRFIDGMKVRAIGMKLGNAPDGSEEIWEDNAELRVLAINEFAFSVPIMSPDEDDHIEGQPRTLVGADLAPLIVKATGWIKGGVYLIGAIGLFLLWKLR